MKIATVILLALLLSTFAAVVKSGIDSKQAEITSTGIAGISITAARSGAGEVPATMSNKGESNSAWSSELARWRMLDS
ncbi:MAG: hypothetical protein JWR89_729 [Tardiphaga sp.]|uniref:hypothetical protein n=1 Tax=Tardiphaga sp. TaxID=1926292 RepID=UPI00261DF723|nr:hypothetical protein [Tardiphaga sp.]MDB5500827.1 hypothetical protein [Tardiphaga sp.]